MKMGSGKKTSIILDTDIGSDIDDAYALGLVLQSPELELAGVTTVFENTRARARQAQTLLKLAGRPEIPVAAGCGAVLSPRLRYDKEQKSWNGFHVQKPTYEYLAQVKPWQHPACLPEAELPALDRRHGVDFLIEYFMSGNSQTILVTIGPLTNVAMALVKEPALRAKIPRIVSMAAAFDRLASEWNIQADPVAAAIVFNSGIPMTVVGLDVTTRCVFKQAQMDALHQGTTPLSKNLWLTTEIWQKKAIATGWETTLPVLHDPLAVETLIKPDLVKTKRGKVSVELSGDSTYGYTVFQLDLAGPHEVAVEVRATAAVDLWINRILCRPH